MGFDIDKLKFVEVEIPSHRLALGKVLREGCREGLSGQEKNHRLISFGGLSMRRKTFSLAAISMLIVAAVIACFLLLPFGAGDATENIEKSKLMEKALIEAREFMPEAETLEENKDFGNDLNIAFIVRDGSGVNLGMIIVDRATGGANFYFDARGSSSPRATSDVRISLEEATAIAEGYLEALGVDMEHFALEKGPLVCTGMEGPPDDPKPVYSYEFNYRMQVNGIFVDDVEHGQGSCVVTISPVDGSIKAFTVPKRLVSIPDLKDEELVLSKEDAIEIASEEVKGREIMEGMTPVVQSDNIELRYMVMGNSRLVPYWKVTVRYLMEDLADIDDYPESAKYIGGCMYSISAVDGQILSEGSYK